MNRGVAIDFAGRRLEDLAAEPLSEPQHVNRSVDRGLGRLHWVVLVVDRRCRAGQIVDLVDLNIERKCYVMSYKFEVRQALKMRDIAFGAGEKVVDAKDFVSLLEQAVDEV